MSKSFYLKTNQKLFDTKKLFNEHLKFIRDTANNNPNGAVLDNDHIADLKDYIQDYHNDSQLIQDEFNLDNCEFFMDKSPDYQTKCLWIKDKETQDKRQISTTRYVNPSTARQNFISCCSYIISEYKKSIRKKLSDKENKDFTEYDLWHIQPSTKVLVEEFIIIHELSDILDDVVSPNGQRNNAPYLMPNYEYLKQEFLDFYQNKMASNQLQTILKARNS